jgi:ribosome biogenesis SPOUT family RNA methylase Rps3
LGGHPPRDRPAPIRKLFENVRHLGDLQLATDTAVLVTRLIMHNKINLKDVPMVREPTIKGKNSKG